MKKSYEFVQHSRYWTRIHKYMPAQSIVPLLDMRFFGMLFWRHCNEVSDACRTWHRVSCITIRIRGLLYLLPSWLIHHCPHSQLCKGHPVWVLHSAHKWFNPTNMVWTRGFNSRSHQILPHPTLLDFYLYTLLTVEYFVLIFKTNLTQDYIMIFAIWLSFWSKRCKRCFYV